MMRIAIIDLGTNTFNLLVAEVKDQGFERIHKLKFGVKLGAGGINDGIIIQTAYNRGLKAIEQIIKKAKQFDVDTTLATATAGIRSTQNGEEFIKSVKDLFKIDVQIITGDREAELIYKGVRGAVDLNHRYNMILDIGGGSNEFIIANNEKVYWKKSFDLGMARLLDKFHPSDPISRVEIVEIGRYLESELKELDAEVARYNPSYLIGSSGTFDTFRSVIQAKNRIENDQNTPSYVIRLNEYEILHKELLQSTAEQRLLMKGMEPVRVEMIVLASIFVNFIVKRYNLQFIIQSEYSIKEGVLAEYIQENIES